MEDCLHVLQMQAKQWPNDRQYLIRTVHVDNQNRTEIGVDRALTLTGTPDPGAGVEIRINFLRQRGIACTNGKSPAPRPGETRQIFLTYTLVLKRIFFYDQISQISFLLYNAQSFEYFLFSFYEFNYLHQNLTPMILKKHILWNGKTESQLIFGLRSTTAKCSALDGIDPGLYQPLSEKKQIIWKSNLKRRHLRMN